MKRKLHSIEKVLEKKNGSCFFHASLELTANEKKFSCPALRLSNVASCPMS
jgi:hypothetical protein